MDADFKGYKEVSTVPTKTRGNGQRKQTDIRPNVQNGLHNFSIIHRAFSNAKQGNNYG